MSQRDAISILNESDPTVAVMNRRAVIFPKKILTNNKLFRFFRFVKNFLIVGKILLYFEAPNGSTAKIYFIFPLISQEIIVSQIQNYNLMPKLLSHCTRGKISDFHAAMLTKIL